MFNVQFAVVIVGMLEWRESRSPQPTPTDILSME